MDYSYSQIVSSKKIFLNSRNIPLILWFLILIPVLIPQIFLPFTIVLIGILVYDLYQKPYRNDIINNVDYNINWPDFLELNRPQKINVNWKHFDPSFDIKIFFPKEFSPRVIHLNQKDTFFKVRSKKKGYYSNIDIYIGFKSNFGIFRYYHKVLHERKLYVAPPILYLSLKYFQIKEDIIRKYTLGTGSEFHSIRQYQYGDPLKIINWKKTAINPNEVYVNQYQKRTKP